MRSACSVPSAVAGALMPDAHVGYGLPIGGVLATEGTVIPYAVGVDIACRMKLSVLDLPTSSFAENREPLRRAIERGTRFGVGAAFERKQTHDVMDQDWTVSRVTRENKDKAWKQLGSSGSGNHFVEFGLLTLTQRDEKLGLDPGEYVALLSHSGSRGTGASVCSTYSAIAQRQLPGALKDFGRLAWLSLDSQEGQEYWLAMNLMGTTLPPTTTSFIETLPGNQVLASSRGSRTITTSLGKKFTAAVNSSSTAKVRPRRAREFSA